jgi:dihydrofolate reductase
VGRAEVITHHLAMTISAMPGPDRIESYAIVSADGMLANAQRVIPDELKVDADQKFFHSGLAGAAVIVHGRHSHEGGPDADRRHRLIVSTRVPALAPTSLHPLSILWNPKGATLAQALTELGAPAGMLAVIGGPDVYALFLDIGYDAFHLSRVANVRIPGGRPVFPEISASRTPEDVLTSRRLKPGPLRILDADRGVTLVTWQR